MNYIGTYTIKYENGETESGLTLSSIRAPKKKVPSADDGQDGEPEEGDDVVALYKGSTKWLKAKVLRRPKVGIEVPVALKFMKHRDELEREIRSRQRLQVSASATVQPVCVRVFSKQVLQ